MVKCRVSQNRSINENQTEKVMLQLLAHFVINPVILLVTMKDMCKLFSMYEQKHLE